jgi:geranylgeranyl diphosphate synthase type II
MIKDYCRRKLAIVNQALNEFLPDRAIYPPALFEAMRYSLFAGGKRLRPILFMAAADAVGGDGSRFLHVASGLEMIHTYSLIHDDLPAMDNDDYRRGKLTNHKVFGEGLAILAGDGLLTLAFEVMLSQPEVDVAVLRQVVKQIAAAAGPQGMVGGQTVDLLSEGEKLDHPSLQWMHQAKTGALFRAAVCSGGILAGASPSQVQALTTYAEEYGLTFQITDDILDVIGNEEQIGKPVGSDTKNDKVTYVSLHSLAGAQQLAQESVERALAALADFGEEATVLRGLVGSLISRES